MEKIEKTLSNEMKLAPLRRLDDFILGDARFQIPNVKDLEKWGNRVVNNLLYYQTNYFVLAICIFLLVGYLNPQKIIMGFVAMTVLILAFAYFSTEGRAIHNFKKKFPVAGIVLVILTACFVTYTLGSLLIFLVGILLPFCVIFVHASMRLRSIKNKMANKIEGLGLKQTPMGFFLDSLENFAGLTISAQTSLFQKCKAKDTNPAKASVLF